MPSNWTCSWCGAENPWPHMKLWARYEMACTRCEAKHELEIGHCQRITDGLAEMSLEAPNAR